MVDPLKYDHEMFLIYINETENELLRIGEVECNNLRDLTQLSAVIILLLRAASLLHSILSITQNGRLDACDAVRRAFFETWVLAFEFRLEGSASKTAKWHADKSKSKIWRANLNRVKNYANSHCLDFLNLGGVYGGLSEVAHPTKSSAMNSVAVLTARGANEAEKSISKSKIEFQIKDFPYLMIQLIWLIFEEGDGLIKIGAKLEAMPNVYEYAKSLSGL